MLAEYEQATGLFEVHAKEGVVLSGHGYSGRGSCRDDPGSEHIRGCGPIPRGMYRISLPFHHIRNGPLTFRLDPWNHAAHGRGGFQIHGDNARGDQSASSGCIILARPVRARIHELGVRWLYVYRDGSDRDADGQALSA